MKPSLLFVEREQSRIAELIEQLVPLQSEWDVMFAETGERALQILANNEIDIVFANADIVLPSGANLLGEIKRIFPRTIRFAMVQSLEHPTIPQVSQYVHQFVTRPITREHLKNRINRTLRLKSILTNEKVANLVKDTTTVPSLPEIYLQIEEEARKPNFSLPKIANLISKDPNLAAKVLQIVNSALFGIQREVTNISFAITYLGVNVIKSLVFYIQLLSSFKVTKDNRKYLEQIWQHSLIVASTSYRLAQKFFSHKHDMDAAYTAGVLHDIGKFVLLNTNTYPQNVKTLSEQKYIDNLEAEQEIFGCTHSEIGGYLLGLWGFPHSIVEAVVFHHQPSLLETSDFTLASAIHFANILYYLPPIDIKHIRSIGFERDFLALIETFKRPRPFSV